MTDSNQDLWYVVREEVCIVCGRDITQRRNGTRESYPWHHDGDRPGIRSLFGHTAFPETGRPPRINDPNPVGALSFPLDDVPIEGTLSLAPVRAEEGSLSVSPSKD